MLWHILSKSFLFVRQLMMNLFLFAYLFTHLVKCTVIISIKNNNVISKYCISFMFSKNIEIYKYILNNYAMRLMIFPDLQKVAFLSLKMLFFKLWSAGDLSKIFLWGNTWHTLFFHPQVHQSRV